MLKFIGKRLLLFIPVLLGVLLIVFTISYLAPADPVYSIMGYNISEEQYQAKYEQLGLDDPFFVRFFDYVKNVVTKFDLGTSYQNKRSVSTQIGERLGVTVKLGILGLAITVLLGIPFGIVSATRQNSVLDYGVTVFSLFFASMPNFWLALMLIILLSLKAGWLPATGINSWKGWIMPCVTLGMTPLAAVTRMTRSAMLEVIRQDYIRTAYAKGLLEREVIWKHAIRNAMIPVVTTIGTMVSMIFGGSVVIESIFNIPGLGMLMQTAITNADYPIVLGSVLVISFFVCLINLLVDLLYGFLDPRIKAQYTTGGKKKRSRGAAAKGQVA